ncbi:LysR family transcriptional regulator [Aliikangiella coralliicola]|uniref:LysR family transcriptional regulator n=1 Tax=Aliikangiella coralliicola TaxID=2592383 RepID=A0A545UJA3_9GAMM|nr:LysR family transcriptional regulator [Aliikangiella coralliicola]TQV89542.1 LysR family transcriptional regulator [Aliikangiella coralliicola]
MKLNTDRLNAFYQVGIEKNFGKAADVLCITQSALSQRVLKLEQELGTNLLIRSTDGIALTESGKYLFDYVKDLEIREKEALNHVTGQSAMANGIIRVGAFSSVMRSVVMPALIPLINSAHQLKAEFLSRELRELPSLLISGEVDFILTYEKTREPGEESVFVGNETMVHIRNRSPKFRTLTPCFLDHDVHDMTTYDFFEQQGMGDLEFDRSFYDDVYGLIDGVRMGFGEAIVSKHMVKEDDEIEIVQHEQTVQSPIILSYIKNRYISNLQREVITHLLENMPKYL